METLPNGASPIVSMQYRTARRNEVRPAMPASL